MRGLASYRCKFHFYLGDVFVFFLIVAAGGGSAGAAVGGCCGSFSASGVICWWGGLSGCRGCIWGGGRWAGGGFTSAFAWFLADMAWVSFAGCGLA